MVKEQFRETNVASEVANISFKVDSMNDMLLQANVEVIAKNLYHEDTARTPIQYGALDRRMGASSMNTGHECQTCGKKLNECMGHFGYLNLELPVFHVGYFRSIVQILQMICKTCARVMLTENEKKFYSRRVQKPNLTYMERKVLRKKIWEKAKKKTECPSCKANNGPVKKASFLKIIHEKYKNLKETHPVVQEKLAEFSSVMERDGELQSIVQQNFRSVLTETLYPNVVKKLFSRIPDGDVFFLLMNPNSGVPVDLILTRIPVPPNCIRPSIVSDLKAGTNEDYLTMKISEIVFINDVIRKNTGVNVQLYMEQWDFLQLHCALYINSEISGVPPHMQPKKSGRGLVQRLKGKQGRFRGNLSGKRVDFTARTVISPDPNLRIEQVGVPMHVAMTLTYPEMVHNANIELMRQLVKNGTDVYPGANFIQYKNAQAGKRYLKYTDKKKIAQNLKCGDIVERHLRDGDIVLFNRQPSLHKLSIMSHRVKVTTHRTFQFNECVCTPYNADFDGDEMNLHVPQTEEARAEAEILLANKSNLVTPRNGELLIGATQDFITGAYLLTHKNTFFNLTQVTELILCFMCAPDDTMNITLPEPAILKPIKLWTGKQIFSLIMRPSADCPVKINLRTSGKAYTSNEEFCVNDSYVVIRHSELLAGTMDKSTIGSGSKNNIFYVALRNEKYVEYGETVATTAMWRLARLSTAFNINKGISLGIVDILATPHLLQAKEKMLSTRYLKCDEYIKLMEDGRLVCRPGYSEEETLETKILNELSAIRDNIGKVCLKELLPTNIALIMALCGSKGSFINISQMIACLSQQAINGQRVQNGFEHRSLPLFPQQLRTPQAKGFVQNSFLSGLSAGEFYFHAMAGREGLTDTAVKTAETGYMQRRLMKSLEDLCIHYDMTVRNSMHNIIQIAYGGDGFDPTFIEDKNLPVDFKRLYYHIRAIKPYKDEKSMDGANVKEAAEVVLASEEYNCLSEDFKEKIIKFMESMGKKIKCYQLNVKTDSQKQLVVERLTVSQLVEFIVTCKEKYMKALIEPGTAVGALAAQSIGEPGTQMTLKTFHFAGVAAMNITQGVPRIKEIINASPKISTPVITALLDIEDKDYERDPPRFLAEVKARLEKTTLKDILEYFEEVYSSNEHFLIMKLDLKRIKSLQLNVNVNSVKDVICTSKLKLTLQNVRVINESTIIIQPNSNQIPTKCQPKESARVPTKLQPKEESPRFPFSQLRNAIPNIVVQGLPSVSRVVIDSVNIGGKTQYKLFVEGDNFRDVIATRGIDYTTTTSNNTIEVYKTHGIEAAKTTIIKEIRSVMENHGINIDIRHLMLLAALMTSTGEVLGITRQGLAKMKESVLNLASFEKTADHLFDAAYYGQKDIICGVSESIIMGIPIPAGTGTFKLLYEAEKEKLIKRELLFDNPQYHKPLNQGRRRQRIRQRPVLSEEIS